MSDPVSVGDVGVGYWRPNLARKFAALDGAELRWLCDASDESRARWGSRFPDVPLAADIDELLAALQRSLEGAPWKSPAVTSSA